MADSTCSFADHVVAYKFLERGYQFARYRAVVHACLRLELEHGGLERPVVDGPVLVGPLIHIAKNGMCSQKLLDRASGLGEVSGVGIDLDCDHLRLAVLDAGGLLRDHLILDVGLKCVKEVEVGEGGE